MDASRLAARRWLRKAAEDLRVAGRAMEPPPIPAAACFHAQQAAEKSLKAVAACLGAARIPKTHSLLELVALIEGLSGQVPFGPPALGGLDRYAVEPRYPDAPQPREREAAEALVLAQHVYVWAEGCCRAGRRLRSGGRR